MRTALIFVLLFAVAQAVSAAPQPQGSSGCTNGFIRWIHDDADVTTVALATTWPHVAGLISAHADTINSSPSLAACFTLPGAVGHHVRYVCDTAYYRVRALVQGKISKAADITVAVGERTGSATMTDANDIVTSHSINTAEVIDDYVQHSIDFDMTLTKNSHYALQMKSSVSSTTHTSIGAGFFEFQERRCERGTP